MSLLGLLDIRQHSITTRDLALSNRGRQRRRIERHDELTSILRELGIRAVERVARIATHLLLGEREPLVYQLLIEVAHRDSNGDEGHQ